MINLTGTLTLPDSLDDIGDNAFKHCKLTTVTNISIDYERKISEIFDINVQIIYKNMPSTGGCNIQ